MPDAELRVGDTERRASDALLHRAVGDGQLTLLEYEQRAGAVWAARTRAELAVVTRDLPGGLPEARPDNAAAPIGAAAQRVTAVHSRGSVRGPLAAGQPVRAYAVMGSATIDLTGPEVPAEVHVRAVAVMGDVKVRVPAGATVVMSGLAIMGDRSVRVAAPQRGGPLIHIDALAVMGDVQVRSDDASHPAVKMLKAAHRRGSAAIAPSAELAPAQPRRRRPGRVAGVALAAGLGVATIAAANLPETTTVMGSQTVRAVAGERVDAAMLMGSITVVVPDTASARLDGFVIMGSTECQNACTTRTSDPVRVDVTGAMGSVEVLTEAEYAAAVASDRTEDRDGLDPD